MIPRSGLLDVALISSTWVIPGHGASMIVSSLLTTGPAPGGSFPGAFGQGKAEVLDSVEGTFAWERRMSQGGPMADYFTGGDARSNTLVSPRT